MSNSNNANLDKTAQDILKLCGYELVEDNIYVLMPAGKRVNFETQQTRALNLCWALWRTNKIKTESVPTRVAVIGGGITGITAASALYGLGCSVDLFEKNRQLMNAQASTHHRYL